MTRTTPAPAPAAKPVRTREQVIAGLTADELQRIKLSFHESAHSTIGCALGGTLHSAFVGGGKATGLQGLTTFTEMSVGRQPVVALSGPYAEARWLAGRRPTRREVDAALAVGGSKDAAAITAAGTTITDVFHDAAALIDRCWSSIVTVAQKLHLDGEARHEHVCAALGLSDRGGPGSFELALIRSGAVPGSFTTVPAAL